MKRTLIRPVVAVALLMAAVAGHTQPYPAKPVTIVTSGAPFGLTDISARLVALKITDSLGQQVGVQNRLEERGTAAVAAVVRSAPDGHTLLVVDEGYVVNPHLVRNPPYDAIGDFVPVSLLARAPLVLVVNSRVPARTVAELAQVARAKPGLVTFATTGPVSAARLFMEAFKLDARTSVTNVPYPDAAQAVTDIMAGRTDAIFTTLREVGEHLGSGRIRALAVTSEAPIAALPGVPTMKETYPAFVAYFWVGMLAPAKTPAAVVARLNGDVAKVLRSDELKERFGNLGLETVGSTTAEFEQWLKREFERWGRVVREGKVTLE